MSNARVDQLVREASVFDTTNARIDQLTREAWIQSSTNNVRVNQLVREAWVILSNRIVVMGGIFQDSLGNPVAGGLMTIRLPEDAVAPDGQTCAGVISTTPTDSSGNIVPIFLWDSASLTSRSGNPSFYILRLYTAGGELCWKTNLTLPNTPNPYNIVNAVPLPV